MKIEEYYDIEYIRYFSDALGVLEIIYKPLPEYSLLFHLKELEKDDTSNL